MTLNRGLDTTSCQSHKMQLENALLGDEKTAWFICTLSFFCTDFNPHPHKLILRSQIPKVQSVLNTVATRTSEHLT